MLPVVKKISPHLELYIYDLKKLCDKSMILLDNNLVQICEGDSDTSLTQAKSIFLDFLSNKDETTKIGAIAEFFVHLFLREHGFKQEFLFFNLEERSIKKGFDGYFSKNDVQYIVESKSGLESTKNISHQSKIKEAYRDISLTISGNSKKSSKGKNNPWKNAYNHACHINVGTNKSIRSNLKKLSDLFDQGTYQDVENFNIIPCSTIYVDETDIKGFSSSILAEQNEYFSMLKAKTVKIVCVTNSTFSAFFDYLTVSHE